MPSKSKKQARLMAAVAHNPKFAKKVGIPQSVGREFNDADKKIKRFAEGGKVAQALRFLKLGLKNRDTPVLSNPATAEDVRRLRMLMKEEYPHDRYLRTWESENNSFAFPASAAIHGQVLKQLEQEFPHEKFTMGLGITLDEMLDQIASKGRFTGHDSKFDPDADDTHPGFAEGGEVLPSSKDDEEPWSDTYVKRPLSGLASMWGGTDPETGDFVSPAWHNLKRAWNMDERRRQGLPDQGRASLGIIDETISLPALGGIVGLPVPEFASEAEERASNARAAARGTLGLDAPHGFKENIAESVGVMAGQLPVPSSVANRLNILKKGSKVGKALGPAIEWFSPTVVPKVSNYLKGALFGGTLGGGLDYVSDYLDEKEAEERNKQFISEAIAEVLEEERVAAAQESGDEASDDEALAELGYAEGGKVSAARHALTTIRDALADPAENKAVRQAKIDEALRKLTVPGTVELPKTVRAQLNEQRDAPGIQSIVDKALPLVQPARQIKNFDPKSIVLNLPPPAQVVSPDNLTPGFMSDQEFERRLRSLGYHDKGANPALTREMDLLDQDDKDWDKMFGYAEGGRVGAPLSQEWYENYGQGPEHLFLGDRSIPNLEGWSPSRPTAPQTPPTSGGGSSTFNDLIGLASLGIISWDAYKDLTEQAGAGLSNIDWSGVDMDFDGVDTQGTLDWINQDLSDMEMPTAEFAPTALERVGQGAGGAFNLAMGAVQGGVGGAGSALQGGKDIYQALSGNDSALMERVGVVGSMLSNIGDGTVEGYLKAGGDAAALAQAMGYSGPLVDAAGKFLPIVGDLFNAYEGIQQGGVRGYVNAAGSLMQAYSALQAAGLLGGTGAAAAGAGAAAGAAGAAGAGAAGAAGAGAAGAGAAGTGAAAGTAGAGAAGAAGASSSVMSSLGPALALWAAGSAAIDWAGKKYGDTKIGDIYGTDWMSGPVDETRYYVRNPFEGDIGSFQIHSDDVGAAPTAALREQWQQQGIDDSGISDYDARILSHLQNQGNDSGYGSYLDWLTEEGGGKDQLEGFDWESYLNSGLVIPVT